MIFAFLLGGCASASRVHETSPGIFTVTATGDGYTTADRVFDLVTTKANDKCAKKGEDLKVVDSKQARTRMGIDTTITLNFRCVSKNQAPEPKVVAKASPESDPTPKAGTSGSGFFVSKLGHIITNEHVVRECSNITVGDNANRQVAVEMIVNDRRNDLALLKLSSTSMASAETKSLISKLGIRIVAKSGDSSIPLSSNGLLRSEDVELGENVIVGGYPYGDLFSNTIKVTKGIVSAIKGMGDDSGQFQMDAAVQAGNSGGPIYDEKGNIVGVVVAQLNKLKVAKVIGSLPENVNFGIKASTVRQFMTSAGLPTKWSNRSERRSTKELAQIAKHQTVMVVCNP